MELNCCSFQRMEIQPGALARKRAVRDGRRARLRALATPAGQMRHHSRLDGDFVTPAR